jgi:hypothetical protein
LQDVALRAGSRHARTIAEVLVKRGVVFLHAGCGRCIAAAHCAVDDVKATLPLVQPQLKVGIATPREVLCPELDVEDAVGSSATYRGEDTEPTVHQIQVVPVWEDRVVVGGPRQANVAKGRIGSHELSIAVRRQIDVRKGLIVQAVREGQRDGDHPIILVIAGVRRAWHDRVGYLSYVIMV